MKIFQLIDLIIRIFRLNKRAKAIALFLIPFAGSCQGGFYMAGEPYLLDAYPGASAAYSVHKLKRDYTGNAMQIRRASDNATANIGFIDDNLDTPAISSHCTGTDCFVQTWYDQSGNGNNAAQSTAANQPKIWDSATGLVTENGKPAILLDGNDDAFYFLTPSGLLGNDDKSIFAIFRGTQDTLQGTLDIGTRTNTGGVNNNVKGYGFSVDPNNILRYYHTGIGNYFGGYLPPQTQYTVSIHIGNNAANPELYANGLEKFESTDLTPLVSPYIELPNGYTGIGNLGGSFSDTKIQEIIFYAFNQTANRVGIETSINNYFSIY